MNQLLRSIALSLFVLCVGSAVSAQQYTFYDFAKVDSLASEAKPKDGLALIEKINQQARLQKNPSMLIKSVIYRMIFQSYLEENAFDKILTDLRKDIGLAKQPEKSILQSLLAETYWNYYQQNRWQISQRTNVQGDTSTDIRTWSIKKLLNETTKTYLASLTATQLLQNTKVDVLDAVLTGDKTNRSFRPTLYDLLAHRAIDVFSNTESNITQYDEELVDLNNPDLFGKQQTFINIKLPQGDTTSFTLQTLTLFQNLLKFHQKGNYPSALADVDLKRLKFTNTRYNGDNQDLYFSALNNLAKQSTLTEVYADILYEQAKIHKNAQLAIDTNKQNLVKAVALAEQAIKVYPKSIGGKNAEGLIKEIKKTEINLKIKEYIQPEKPAQLYFSYKNVDTIHLKLFKIPGYTDNEEKFKDKKSYYAFLKNTKSIKDWFVAVPKTTDYQIHTLIDKIDGLLFGSYLIIAQNINKQYADTVYANINFKVTNLAAKNRTNKEQYEYYITDLAKGLPIKGAKIQHRDYNYNTKKYVNNKLLVTDEKGFAKTTDDDDPSYALITYGKDVLNTQINYYKPYRRDDEDEDIRARVILFTDRPIYRPGQTVYFKGISIKPEKGKNKILTDHPIEVNFKDANYKKIQTLNLTSNDFGTFQGSFNVPLGLLNGQMEIETDYGSVNVQVEEYKRPTFEIVFDKPKQKYKLNDSIKVTGKATSFAGYSVSNAKVSYKIFRRAIYDDQQYKVYRQNQYNRTQIAIGKTNTAQGGKFNITFFAKATEVKLNYTYEVETEITDLNGETRSKNTSVNVGKKDIVLNFTAPTIFVTNKTDTLLFNITNLNNQPIKADIKVEWSLLQAPSRLMNKAPFTAENYAFNQEEFIKNFPFDEYNNELELDKWPIKSVEFNHIINVDKGFGHLTYNQKQLKPGYYKIKLTAVNQQNDSVSLDRFTVVYGKEPTIIQSSLEWITAEKTNIKPNESAVFRLAGLSENAKAYYEVYYRDSIMEKVWLDVSPIQKIINIKPKSNYEDGFAVQFTMVHQGTAYNAPMFVKVIDPKKELDIKFLTFRNKLQPGEKESWKLQISNKSGDKQMAEMIATLYDASLDDLKKMDWKTDFTTNFNYNFYNWNYTINEINDNYYLWFLRNEYNFYTINRTYESLNLFGYNHYSGYRSYVQNLNKPKKGLSADAKNKLAELAKGKLVYGAVFDSQGYTVPGVIIKTGKLTTTTNAMGIYAIDAKIGETITYKYIGFNTCKIVVRDKKRIDVTLKEDGNALNEVVVTSNDVQRKSKTLSTGSSVKIMGRDIPTNISSEIVEDNTVYNFESINHYDPKTGLEMVNGKPVIKIQNITPRTNFSETAFFYPQLLTNAKGEINIEFTIPQSLTRYKMMGFAHTKDLKTASITNELVTQKQLAISANAPRFFREGDTILLNAKLNNLAGKKLIGNASLQLTNALTGKEIQLFTPQEKAEKTFELNNEGNTVLKWALIIPAGISAITYKVLAQSGKFSDGEENTIPVLPNAMLVTETMPINVRGNTSKTFNFDKLEKSGTSKTLRNQSLTFEFTSNPVWYAVQALPYLMEYPYECAEQTFSRFFANSFATGILNSSPKIKTVFEQWKNTNNGQALLSNLEKNPELKSILLEETPWVRNADNETERKKRLSTLFDLNRMTYELKNNFEKLEKMQYGNGAFPWFSGMGENRYITQHIVLGMGQLKKSKLIDEKAFKNFNVMLNKAIIYLDNELEKDYKLEIERKQVNYLPLHYLFARSYTNQQNNGAGFIKVKNYYLDKIASSWKTFDTYQLAQTALVLYRNGNTAEAQKIITLLKQTAQQSDEMGMYWTNNKAGWWWYQSPIETQALLIEAFDEVANDQKAVEEMKIWLLKNKQTNDWKTTKATTAACYALLMKGTNLLAESNEPEITIGNLKLTDLQQPNTPTEAGTGYQKTTVAGANVKPEMGKVTVKNNNKTIAWGAMYWQYFEQLDKITPANTGVKIKKQLFLQKASAKGDILTPLTTTNTLSPGDLLKVRIEIYCDRDMEYVHLKDMRSSGFEPINVISQYKYQDGLGYYESTKDASTNFFISYLRKGTYVFEYPLRVTHSGNFSNGITTLQSMYAPEFTTHSEGIRVNVK